MKALLKSAFALALAAPVVAACASAPRSVAEQRDLEARAAGARDAMVRKDPALGRLLDSSYAYIVFPQVGKGGVIVGGAHGQGVLFIDDRPRGYVELNQASIGAQLGGQTFAELIVLRDRFAVDAIRAGKVTVDANASAVAVSAGAAANAQFSDGIAIFIEPHGGLMAELSVGGQTLELDEG